MTRGAVVAAATAAGVLAGVVIAYAAGGSYRAATSLAVQRGGTPVAAPTVARLVDTKLFADNVGVDSVRAHVPHGTALVELSYEDDSAAHATQVVQRAATTLQSLVTTRFPALRVAVVDPARSGSARHHVVRDGLLGGLVGLLAGAFVPLQRRRPRAEPVSGTVPVSSTPAPPPPPPTPVPAPAPEPVAGPLDELRETLAARRDEFPAEQVAEWEAYLAAFEAQIEDGELPAGLRGMLGDVFEPLLRPS